MIAHPLPRPGRHPDKPQTGVFTDLPLFTGTVEDVYDYPEHTTGLGILTMVKGSGECCLNKQRERLEGQTWMLMNKGSRLSLHLTGPGTAPVMLFLVALGNSCSSFHCFKSR